MEREGDILIEGTILRLARSLALEKFPGVPEIDLSYDPGQWS